ncbi:DNA polymerase III subunit gamma/tau [Candidatus Roizmanbacteria bacterium]|nr:DNA polymerase III subunit gamma/tau [Candidatus Roizmanbacteria bacterium]
MFYLKYRPKTIQDLDNSQVKEIVKRILTSKDLPHALLFIGQKGTGKTSTARIFAKAINCLEKTAFEPCNKCKNCLSIDSSSSSDVIELDAASNRGIEDIRNLIRESNFYPMTNKFRVFIIDEAHMITTDAFNALLKTLEEPPASVIFILATTNQEKIPKTIVSRCVIVNFAKAKKSDIISMLKRIVSKEKAKIDPELLPLIAKHSDHSFRDATKILEELIVQQKLTFNEGKQFLGILRENFFDSLQKRDLKETLSWIEDFSQSGGNIKYLLEQLLDELRLALLAKNGVKTDEVSDLSLEMKDIILLMKLFSEAYNNLKISPIESLPLEIAVAEYYNKTNKNGK